MINGPPPLGKTLVRICLSVSSSNCNLIIIDHHHNCRFQHQRHLCHDDHDENHQARRAVSLEASVEASHCPRRKPASVFFASWCLIWWGSEEADNDEKKDVWIQILFTRSDCKSPGSFVGNSELESPPHRQWALAKGDIRIYQKEISGSVKRRYKDILKGYIKIYQKEKFD